MGSFVRSKMTTVGPGQKIRKDRVVFNSFSIKKPDIIYNAIPSSRFRDEYQLYNFEDDSLLRRLMYGCYCAPTKDTCRFWEIFQIHLSLSTMQSSMHDQVEREKILMETQLELKSCSHWKKIAITILLCMST